MHEQWGTGQCELVAVGDGLTFNSMLTSFRKIVCRKSENVTKLST